MISIKEKLLAQCVSIIIRKQELLAYALNDINESITTETKSSVGDKHETARARMQFEQEKLNKQLFELNEQMNELKKIDTSTIHKWIGFGSLVETNKGLFFISAALGKIELNTKLIYSISPLSPIAIKMQGLEKNVRFEFNKTQYTILNIV